MSGKSVARDVDRHEKDDEFVSEFPQAIDLLISLRPTENEDRARLVSLWAECERFYEGGKLDVPTSDVIVAWHATLQSRLDQFLDSGGVSWLAAFHAELVGTISMVRLPSGRAFFTRFFVLPDHRLSGVGREILVEALIVARRAGFHNFQLTGLLANTQSTELFESLGFVRDTSCTDFTIPDELRAHCRDFVLVRP